MLTKIPLLALLTVPFFIAVEASAVTFLEDGDAPALLPGQSVVAADPLMRIDGAFSGRNDVDLYRIRIPNGDAFSASAVAGPSATSQQVLDFDSQLFLLEPTGRVIVGTDDIDCSDFEDCNGRCVSLLTDVEGLAPGIYVLAISRWPIFPASIFGSLFALVDGEELNPVCGNAFPSGIYANSPLSSWFPALDETRFPEPFVPDYVIDLVGAARDAANICGDLTNDLLVKGDDVDDFRELLAFGECPVGSSCTGRCNVISPVRPCDVLDLAVLRRAVEGPNLGPGLVQTCSDATN